MAPDTEPRLRREGLRDEDLNSARHQDVEDLHDRGHWEDGPQLPDRGPRLTLSVHSARFGLGAPKRLGTGRMPETLGELSRMNFAEGPQIIDAHPIDVEQGAVCEARPRLGYLFRAEHWRASVTARKKVSQNR